MTKGPWPIVRSNCADCGTGKHALYDQRKGRTMSDILNTEKPVMKLVCAWCDVYCRVERVLCDDEGQEIERWTVCAYCGRSELRFGKRGWQTPIPPAPAPPDRFPF